jgi:hypothetical protein
MLGAADGRTSEADGRAQITYSWAVVAGAIQVGVALGGPVRSARAAAARSASGMACRSW